MGYSRTMSRKFLLAALFASALLAVAIAADAEVTPTDEEPPEEEFDPVKDGTKEMEEMDSNKDGKATAEEVKAFMKSRYYTKEEDLKDLENDEGKPATPEDITKMIDRDATELIEELDKDKSGDLNLEEVIAQYKDDGSDMDEGADEPADDAGEEGDEPESDEGADE